MSLRILLLLLLACCGLKAQALSSVEFDSDVARFDTFLTTLNGSALVSVKLVSGDYRVMSVNGYQRPRVAGIDHWVPTYAVTPERHSLRRGAHALGYYFYWRVSPGFFLEIWRTDGSYHGEKYVGGVQLSNHFAPQLSWAVLGDRVYVASTSGFLAVTRGEADDLTLQQSAALDGLGVSSGLLFYTAQGQLWVTEGLPSEAVLLTAEGESIAGAHIVGEFMGQLYVTGIAPDGRSYLYRTGGTPQTTTRIAPLYPPELPAIQFASRYIGHVVGDRLVIASRNPPHPAGFLHREWLWSTDGTGSGTVELSAAIGRNGVWGAVPMPFAEFQANVNGSKLFFGTLVADQSGEVQRIELWATDGSVNGTELVWASKQVDSIGNIRQIAVVRNRIYLLTHVLNMSNDLALMYLDGDNLVTIRRFEVTSEQSLVADVELVGVLASQLAVRIGTSDSPELLLVSEFADGGGSRGCIVALDHPALLALLMAIPLARWRRRAKVGSGSTG